MISKKLLIKQWEKEEKYKFEGWNFSHIKNRLIEENPPWNYKKIAKKLIKNSECILDEATGGGEVLSSLIPLPKMTFAIEGYRPNFIIAKNKLNPLKVKVFKADASKNLPFDNNTFDLILNRHGAINYKEIHRILKNKGLFLTQQVGSNNLYDLAKYFNSETKYKNNTLKNVKENLIKNNFNIKISKEWSGKIRFKDIGSIVYFLKAVPWIVNNFSVKKYLDNLLKLQNELNDKGSLDFTIKRFIILAEKR